MPELPEVEYTARQLRHAIMGTTIQDALVFWALTIGQPDLPDFLAEIADRRILGVRRCGKFLVMDLDGNLILTIHRRMTGNLLLLPPGWEVDTSLRETDPAAWDRKGPTFCKGAIPCDQVDPEISYAVFCLKKKNRRRLLFTDPRKFGRIELWPREREAE